jgi:peptidoglycan hydrolase-like protein with peptidoglycan-binding domain
VAKELTKLNFDVSLSTDRSLAELNTDTAAFYNKLADADIVLFYFAGHGVQINGRNYLVATDVNPENSEGLIAQSLPIDDVLLQIERRSAPSASKIIILDACRDNPFALHPPRPGERTSRGLSPMEWPSDQPKSNRGTAGYFRIIAFATSPNTTAADGLGSHSPYTQSLIKHISEPGLEVGEVFRRVAADVLVETTGAQHPEFLVQNSRLLYFTTPTVTACDKTASDEQNFLGLKGVPFDDVDPTQAVPACEAAVNAQPDSARLNHNLARAYEKSERLVEALEHYRKSAGMGYPPAINALGIMYLGGCGLPRRQPEMGIKEIARARALGDLSARASLTAHDVLPYVKQSGVVQLQMALLLADVFHGRANGVVGPSLRAALRAYQKNHNLADNGLTLETINELGIYDVVPEGFRCH